MQRVSDVDLRLLRVFATVADAGGFAAASAHLNVSVSTISIHMTNLETRLGMRLCERGRGGFKLTERGRLVYRETKAMLQSLDDFAGTLAGVKSMLAGRLAIGISDALVSHPDFSISDKIRRFNAIENDVEIDLVVAAKQDLEHDVVDGRIHMAIGPFVRNKSGLAFTPMFRETHDLYCGAGHALFNATKRQAEKADLSQYRAVVRLYHQDFDLARLGVVRQAATVNSMEGMLSLLLSGGYIGYLPRHYARPWADAGRLAPIKKNDMAYESQHGLITKPGKRHPLALDTFMAIARDRTDGKAKAT